MKTLSDYSQDKQTALFNETGSFFAFGYKQFLEARKEGVKYCDLGYGLICLKENVDQLLNGLEKINKEALSEDLSENGPEAIISRELWNHESFYDYDFSRAIEALKDYNFPKKLINKVIEKEKKAYRESDNF